MNSQLKITADPGLKLNSSPSTQKNLSNQDSNREKIKAQILKEMEHLCATSYDHYL